MTPWRALWCVSRSMPLGAYLSAPRKSVAGGAPSSVSIEPRFLAMAPVARLQRIAGDRRGARADLVGADLLHRASAVAMMTPVHLTADVALAVCLLFDRRSERAVRALWDRGGGGRPSLRSHTHGSHVPHVSYAVLRRWDQDAVSAALDSLDGGAPWNSVRRARAVPTRPDLAGRRCQRRLRGTATAGRRRRYGHRRRSAQALVPGTWLPHCSLAPRATLAQLSVVAAAVFDMCRCVRPWTVPRWSTARPARSAR